MKRNSVALWAILAGAVIHLPSVAGQDLAKKDGPPRSRTFRFNYGATLNDLPVGSRVRVWLPVPQSSDHQMVTVVKQDLPVVGQTSTEPMYGNKILYFEIGFPLPPERGEGTVDGYHCWAFFHSGEKG